MKFQSILPNSTYFAQKFVSKVKSLFITVSFIFKNTLIIHATIQAFMIGKII